MYARKKFRTRNNKKFKMSREKKENKLNFNVLWDEKEAKIKSA